MYFSSSNTFFCRYEDGYKDDDADKEQTAAAGVADASKVLASASAVPAPAYTPTAADQAAAINYSASSTK